jgi:hypothetical protein
VDLGKSRLLVDVKSTPSAASIGAAVYKVKEYAAAAGRYRARDVVPVIVTSFMGGAGKRLCAEAGVSWFDLSGNADIMAPGLRILIEGKPNKFVRRGRPSSAFAPKSARIARHLLVEPRRWFRQQELSREVELDDGFTSKIVHRLESDILIERDNSGAIRVRNPDLMLDAWSEIYAFEKHSVLRGHITTRSSEDLLRKLGNSFQDRNLSHAATGLAAAWLQTEFAAFRLVTFFVASQPDAGVLKDIGFREEPKGANVWLVVPNDHGVFDGASTVGDVACVHPVQNYVDLLRHPERARDAATELRSRLLHWKH